MKFDIFFKTAILIVVAVVGFTWVVQQQQQSSKQAQPEIGRFVETSDPSIILDSATGALYAIGENDGDPALLIQPPVLK